MDRACRMCGVKRIAYRVLVGKLKEIDSFENRGVGGVILNAICIEL
jgi:hypothetical protein